MKPYKPRSIRFSHIESSNGFELKQYAITQDGDAVDAGDFADGIALARLALPSPAHCTGRPGVGFLIAHKAASLDYLILAWWDRENELPTRVFVREVGQAWRAARGSESFCVWDLQVIAHERDAYVEHVMRDGGSADAYLAAVLEQDIDA